MYCEISLNRLKKLQEELIIHEAKIMRQVYEINKVRRAILCLEEESLNEIAAKLSNIIQELSQDARKMKMLNVALQKIIRTYENCETKILNLDEGTIWRYVAKFDAIDLKPLLKMIDQLQLDFIFQPQDGEE